MTALTTHFGDAIEDYKYLTFNPVLMKIKPAVPVKEAPHLNHIDHVTRLLLAVDDKSFGLAVWIQLYTGLRIGEVQALRWEDLDLEAGVLFLRRTFVRKKNFVRNYPKGKKHFTIKLPTELWRKLVSAKSEAKFEWVVPSQVGTILQYLKFFGRFVSNWKSQLWELTALGIRLHLFIESTGQVNQTCKSCSRTPARV